MDSVNPNKSEFRIRYDVPVEVSKEAYEILKVKYAGILAHRIDDQGRYWIKLWIMSFRKEVEALILKHPLKTNP